MAKTVTPTQVDFLLVYINPKTGKWETEVALGASEDEAFQRTKIERLALELGDSFSITNYVINLTKITNLTTTGN